MAVIRLESFGGEIPLLDDTQLPDTHAVKAQYLKLWGKSLRPINEMLYVIDAFTTNSPKTLYLYGSDWLEFPEFTTVAPSPIGNDQYGRVYFTDPDTGYPEVTDSTRYNAGGTPYPSGRLRLGIPAPTTKPGVTLGGTPTGNPETRYYVYTYVNSYGEEGPPSPVSDAITVQDGEYVDLTFTAPPGGAEYDFDYIRVYRTNTAGSTAVFQYVDEVTLPTVVYQDTKTNLELGEALPSTDWDPPPATLKGIVSVPGEFLAGYSANQLCLTEAGLAHAWPLAYRKAVDHNIVGIGVLENGVVVVTEGQPYIYIGTSPIAMAQTKLKVPYAGVSEAGIATVNGEVIYPSPRGLVAIGMGRAELITEHIIERQDWDQFVPSSIVGMRWRNMYMASYNGASGPGAFIIDPNDPGQGLVDLPDLDVAAGYNDPLTDKLYVSSEVKINQWDAGNPWEYTWRSKPFKVPHPDMMGVIQVHSKAYPVVATVYIDEKPQCTVQIGSPAPRRLTNAKLGRRYSVEIVSTAEVEDVYLARNMDELAKV